MGGRKKVTLADVAREAGTDPANVSQILNGKRRGSALTVERVFAAASKLGYEAGRASAAPEKSDRFKYRGKYLNFLFWFWHSDYTFAEEEGKYLCRSTDEVVSSDVVLDAYLKEEHG